MSEVFIKLFNMSITAGWIVLAVILLRFLLKKAPTWINCVLWGVVALRLIMPFSFESVLSLIPSAQTVTPDIMLNRSPTINSGITGIDNLINPVISETFAPAPLASANPLQILIPVFANLWILGIIGMLLYSVISYLRLNRKVKASVKFKDNVYFCDYIDSPFILGVFSPKIYLPSSISEQEMSYVIKHEQAHLKRKDHFIKPLGFLLLSVYWFNPLIWVAYILLCRDIENACDEKVIKELDTQGIKEYSKTLVSCSVQRKMIMACPLAFGEVGVKERVKTILNYKKPTFWVVVIAIIACIVTTICFLTNPISTPKQLLKKDTHWWCSDYNASFYVDEEKNISGVFTIEKEKIDFDIKINSNNAQFINTLTNEVIINAKIKEQNGTLDFKVKDNTIGLEKENLTFINAVVSVKAATNSGKVDNMLVFFGDKAQLFKDVFDKAVWEDGTTECLYDFNITYSDTENKLTLSYHSDCGTFYNEKTSKSFTMSEDDKLKINAALFVHSAYFSAAENSNPLENAISNAIISNNESDKPTGLLCVESHVIVANASSTPLKDATSETKEIIYLIALYQEFNVSTGDPIEVKRDFSPVKLTFDVSKDGEYLLKEYLVVTKAEQIEQTFPGDSAYDAINKTEFLGVLEESNNKKVKTALQEILIQGGHTLYNYETAVSFANYTSAPEVYLSCWNREKMYSNIVKHLPIFKFETKAQLDDFKFGFKDDLTFDHGYNEVPSFNEIAEKYDEDYFKEKTLFLVYVSTSSGSFRYGVNSVYNDGNNFCIHVEKTNNPEVVTADMSGWFVTVSVEKDAVKNCTSFDADLDNF